MKIIGMIVAVTTAAVASATIRFCNWIEKFETEMIENE